MNTKTPQTLPLYLQIRELLLREIGAGQWLRGERLPPEAELAKQLGVAVGTLRKGLASLEKEGILERRQGSGTYVADSSNQQGQSIYHFFRLEKANGQTGLPSAKVLSAQLHTDAEAAQRLGLAASTCFWCIRRLRKLDGQAIAVEEILLPQVRAPDLTPHDLHESLYLYYRTQLGFWIAGVADAILLGELPAWGAKVLALPDRHVCGLVERVASDQHGQRAEFSRTWFDTHKARYMARWS